MPRSLRPRRWGAVGGTLQRATAPLQRDCNGRRARSAACSPTAHNRKSGHRPALARHAGDRPRRLPRRRAGGRPRCGERKGSSAQARADRFGDSLSRAPGGTRRAPRRRRGARRGRARRTVARRSAASDARGSRPRHQTLRRLPQPPVPGLPRLRRGAPCGRRTAHLSRARRRPQAGGGVVGPGSRARGRPRTGAVRARLGGARLPAAVVADGPCAGRQPGSRGDGRADHQARTPRAGRRAACRDRLADRPQPPRVAGGRGRHRTGWELCAVGRQTAAITSWGVPPGRQRRVPARHPIDASSEK